MTCGRVIALDEAHKVSNLVLTKLAVWVLTYFEVHDRIS